MNFTTIKIYEQTRRKLRLISAMTDEAMVALIERLASQELQRLKEQEQHDQADTPDRETGSGEIYPGG